VTFKLTHGHQQSCHTGCTNKKQSLRKKFCISAVVVQIWTKLSNFVREYSPNISCQFYWNNWYGSSDTAVWTLKFTFSSDHAVAHWLLMNQNFHSF